MIDLLNQWHLATADHVRSLERLTSTLAQKFEREPTSLVHGDLYAENIILRGGKMFIIDWSYFTILGVPLLDLATLTMDHYKNGRLVQFRNELIDAYCFESGRDSEEVRALLPYAETLSRLLFLYWLVERRSLGILGTTVGPVDELIPKILTEVSERFAVIA
jgi:aminoglycoside phosphotransferase (APT) family kinase protein